MENDLKHTDEEEEYHLPHQEQDVGSAAATPSAVIDLRHAPDVTYSKCANEHNVTGDSENKVPQFCETDQNDEVDCVDALEDDQNDA